MGDVVDEPTGDSLANKVAATGSEEGLQSNEEESRKPDTGVDEDDAALSRINQAVEAVENMRIGGAPMWLTVDRERACADELDDEELSLWTGLSEPDNSEQRVPPDDSWRWIYDKEHDENFEKQRAKIPIYTGLSRGVKHFMMTLPEYSTVDWSQVTTWYDLDRILIVMGGFDADKVMASVRKGWESIEREARELEQHGWHAQDDYYCSAPRECYEDDYEEPIYETDDDDLVPSDAVARGS